MSWSLPSYALLNEGVLAAAHPIRGVRRPPVPAHRSSHARGRKPLILDRRCLDQPVEGEEGQMVPQGKTEFRVQRKELGWPSLPAEKADRDADGWGCHQRRQPAQDQGGEEPDPERRCSGETP